MSKVPNDCSFTYESFVCDDKPLKSEPYHVSCVSGGYKLDYPNDPGSPDASNIETKLLLNITIPNAKNVAQFKS